MDDRDENIEAAIEGVWEAVVDEQTQSHAAVSGYNFSLAFLGYFAQRINCSFPGHYGPESRYFNQVLLPLMERMGLDQRERDHVLAVVYERLSASTVRHFKLED